MPLKPAVRAKYGGLGAVLGAPLELQMLHLDWSKAAQANAVRGGRTRAVRMAIKQSPQAGVRVACGGNNKASENENTCQPSPA